MTDLHNEFDRVYDVFETGCAAVRNGDEYFVYTADDELLEMEERNQARIYAGLRTLVGPIPLLDDRDVVPVKVATAGKPFITLYLYMAHRDYYHEIGWYGRNPKGRLELAKAIEVAPQTIQKYLARAVKEIRELKVGGERLTYRWY